MVNVTYYTFKIFFHKEYTLEFYHLLNPPSKKTTHNHEKSLFYVKQTPVVLYGTFLLTRGL